VPIRLFTARDFRCLEHIEFAPAERFNLISGSNGSGKTSILEAIAYLGRGKSFRSAATTDLVRHGTREFVLFGEVLSGERVSRLGVRNGPEGLDIHLDGAREEGAAALANALPLQIIDPEVHELVAGGPERRRRFLDWIGFHVEHGYVETWRRFRRTLKQRNAGLRAGLRGAALAGWDAEFAELGVQLDEARRRALAASLQGLRQLGQDLLECEVDFAYRQGWPEGQDLAAVLGESIERDLRHGSTQSGPQRADLVLSYDARRARKLVSRGQQKLLACGMVLAAAGAAGQALGRPPLLLLDDPGAELDKDSLGRLMRQVSGLGGQVIATSLSADQGFFPASTSLFHVEQGELRPAP